MFRFLIVFVFCALAGCASLASYLKSPPLALPNTASLPCCWQVLEQLDIDYQGERLALSSVIVLNDYQLTVVILDPLGRRIFSVIQQADRIQVEKSDLIKKDLPVEWLLIGVYLRHMPDEGWFFEHSNWTIQHDDRHTLLLQDNRIKVILFESKVHDDITAQLQYPDLKLNINITTLLRQSLE
ncbi:MAG: DUF3261 domain-containing protein [Nitrosomonas sp.]|nr:DUF3261 domain-containing protein [Nitrosomonas sp.]